MPRWIVALLLVLAMAPLDGCARRHRIQTRYGPLPSAPSREVLAETMASASATINGCVNGERQGTLRASVVFAPHGLVAAVDVERWDAPTDEVRMRSCVLDALYRLEVPPFEGKEVRVDVSYELW